MPLEFIVAVLVLFIGSAFFGNFQGETPRAVTRRKWVVYLTLVVALTWTVGRPWSLIWTVLPIIASIGHFAWCYRHGIHPLTAEPRDRYYAARGWPAPDDGGK